MVFIIEKDVVGLDVPVDNGSRCRVMQMVQTFCNVNEAMPYETLRDRRRINGTHEIPSPTVLKPSDQRGMAMSLTFVVE